MLASCSAKLQSPSWEEWIIEILVPLKEKGFLLLTSVQQRPCAATKEGCCGKFLINGGGRNPQIFPCFLKDEKGTVISLLMSIMLIIQSHRKEIKL